MKLGGLVTWDRDVVGAVFFVFFRFCGERDGGNVVVGGGSFLMIDCFDWLRMIIRGWGWRHGLHGWNAWMN